MRTVVRFILLSEAFAVTTFALGWWTVPVIAALWAYFSGGSHRAMFAGLAAGASWIMLLLLDAAKGPVGVMASRLGGVLGIPAIALYVITPLFAALLAWSAAAVVTRFRAAISPQASSL